MNYLHRLEDEGREKSAEIVGLRSILSDIRGYLELPKFAGGPENHWVNPDDILLRIREGIRRTDDLVQDQVRVNRRERGGDR